MVCSRAAGACRFWLESENSAWVSSIVWWVLGSSHRWEERHGHWGSLAVIFTGPVMLECLEFWALLWSQLSIPETWNISAACGQVWIGGKGIPCPPPASFLCSDSAFGLNALLLIEQSLGFLLFIHIQPLFPKRSWLLRSWASQRRGKMGRRVSLSRGCNPEESAF